jgi:circadian clock protein KaiC
MALTNLIAEFQPRCVVVDPLSAMVKAGGLAGGLNMAQSLVRLTKATGITLLCTSLLQSDSPEVERTPLEVSTIADTWVHVSYVIRGGERNRALTIIKSRGTAHSNQVRELILSASGLTLTDVYTAGGEVLLGTARWAKETQAVAEAERLDVEAKHQRQAIENATQEIDARIAGLKRELRLKEAELAQVSQTQRKRREQTTGRQADLVRLRRGRGDAQSSPKPSTALAPVEDTGRTKPTPSKARSDPDGQR